MCNELLLAASICHGRVWLSSSIVQHSRQVSNCTRERRGPSPRGEGAERVLKKKGRRLNVGGSSTIKQSVILLVIFELRVKLWPWFKIALTDASRHVCVGPALPVNLSHVPCLSSVRARQANRFFISPWETSPSEAAAVTPVTQRRARPDGVAATRRRTNTRSASLQMPKTNEALLQFHGFGSPLSIVCYSIAYSYA